VLEISVLMAQFPSKEIARRSYDFRTLGLGYANLGGLLMSMGIPYDSADGRALGGAITALMTGSSYATSAETAGELGAFPGYAENREAMLRVIRNHRRAAHGVKSSLSAPAEFSLSAPWGGEGRGEVGGAPVQNGDATHLTLPIAHAMGPLPLPPEGGEGDSYEGLSIPPVPLDAANCPDAGLAAAAQRSWDKALALGEQHGFRNAQATVLAADRHDRPRHGLRHDRDRAGFRAGEIQEARRRRLFQDHQPRGAAGADDARLQRRRDCGDRALHAGARDAPRCASRQSREPQGKGVRRPGARRRRGGAGLGFRHQIHV